MRRFSVVAVSICVHAGLLLTLFIVPLFATDTLPIPRRVVDYFLPHEVMPVVAPPPALHQPAASAQPAPTSSQPASPNAAPNGISPETGYEGFTGVVGSSGPPVAGIGDTVLGPGVSEPPPPPPAKPIHIHEGIKAPQKIADVAPVYPTIAQAARAQGVVIMEATIDAHGNVTDVRVLRSSPLLDEAAVAAVRQWKYTPTLLNGQPVAVIMTVTINFTLR